MRVRGHADRRMFCSLLPELLRACRAWPRGRFRSRAALARMYGATATSCVSSCNTYAVCAHVPVAFGLNCQVKIARAVRLARSVAYTRAHALSPIHCDPDTHRDGLITRLVVPGRPS